MVASKLLALASLAVSLIFLGQVTVGNEFETSAATFDTIRDPPECAFNVEKGMRRRCNAWDRLVLENTRWTAGLHRFDARGLASWANVWIPLDLGWIWSSWRRSLDFDLLGRRKSTEKPIPYEAINDTRHGYCKAGGYSHHEFSHLERCLTALYPGGQLLWFADVKISRKQFAVDNRQSRIPTIP